MSFDEQAWTRFVLLSEARFEQCDFKEELLKLCNGELDIAWVVYYRCSDNSLKWMCSKIPALDNKTPVSSLKKSPTTLKQVLWSMPY